MKTNDNITPNDVLTPSDTEESQRQARRDALIKLGLIAAWTPPVMMMLMRSKRASAESFPGTPL